MKHISLESGIGGFDYAAEMMGWQNVAHCEINKFCLTVLKYYWPDADTYTDLFTMDGRKYRRFIDIITCGFPCQGFSLAGKGKGDKDDRFIWPENMRIIREVQSPYILAENVPGLLNKHPLVFERVCADLENEGYEVQSVCIPACGAQEDHIRERIFFIAYNQGFGDRMLPVQQWDKRKEGININGQIKNITNNQCEGLERQSIGQARGVQLAQGVEKESWPEAATRLCGLDDVFIGRLDTAAISKTTWRNESIKGYGNSVHWKVAYEIFKAIEATTPSQGGIKGEM